MKPLILLVMMAMGGEGWASSTETWHIGLLPGNHPALTVSAERYQVPAVITSSGGIISLSDFVSSGKFCDWRGKHEWGEHYECAICKKYRWKP